MNFNKFTLKSQEAIQYAVELASEKGQQALEPCHLLKAVIEKGEQITQFIFGKMSVQSGALLAVLNSMIDGLPKVSGAEPYLSKESNDVLLAAEDMSRKDGDEYVSLEYMLLALVDKKSSVQRVLQDAGLTSSGVRDAIGMLRQGRKVDEPTAENNYQALSKYAINLIEQARNGKLDPVIGRDEEIRRVLQILSRRTKNNPILIGEPGVGKTAIAEGLAHRIVRGDVPENLKSKQPFMVQELFNYGTKQLHKDMDERVWCGRA